VLVVGRSLAGSQANATTQDPLTQDQKKAEAARLKADARKAADEKKAADAAAKKEADAKKKALRGMKHTDIDNIVNRNINKHCINFSSIDSEIRIGKQAAAQVEQESQLINDKMVTE